MGQVEGCDGACYDANWLDNGTCDEGLNCDTWGFDSGDCVGPQCGDQVCDAGEESTCPSDCADCALGDLSTCTGSCSPAMYYGDGFCDEEFNCEELALDGGDCGGGECGDGVCTAAEGPLDMGAVAGVCGAGLRQPRPTVRPSASRPRG